MVFMLHGTSHEVLREPQHRMWAAECSNKHGFILVKPARPITAVWAMEWDAYTMDAAFQSPPDDSGFLRNLIVTLTGRYNVNPNQVYVAGFSSGAQMAHRVGVGISDLVAAIAIGSGTIVVRSLHRRLLCPARRLGRSPFRERGGTLDRTIPPCNNGITKYSGASFTWPPWTSLSLLDSQNACTVFQNRDPLCENGLPNPEVDRQRGTCASKRGNIMEQRTGYRRDRTSQNALAGSSLRRTRSNRVRRRARLPRRFPS